MTYLDILNLTLDAVEGRMDRIPENRLTPPSEPEDTRTPIQIATAIAEYLDQNALDPESIMHMAESHIGTREMLFKKFREAAADAIDFESDAAYIALGKTAAEIVFHSVRSEV